MNKWSFWKGTLKATKNLSAASTHKEIGLFRNFSFSYRCFSSQLIRPTEAGVQRQTNLGPKQGPVSSSSSLTGISTFQKTSMSRGKAVLLCKYTYFWGWKTSPFWAMAFQLCLPSLSLRLGCRDLTPESTASETNYMAKLSRAKAREPKWRHPFLFLGWDFLHWHPSWLVFLSVRADNSTWVLYSPVVVHVSSVRKH